jgi:uncharacterized protein (DUF302 family)
MKICILFVTLFFFTSTAALAAEGLINKTSSHSVRVTMDRFEKIVKEKGFNVIARVNHAAAAIKSGSTLRPTELLIFGNPKLGTQLMQSTQTIGIDLPLKVLVWENDKGVVTLSYNDPAWLKQRHGISDKDKVFAKMTGAMDKFSNGAVK